MDDFTAGVSVIQLLLKIPVYDQCDKAGHEVCLDPVITAEICRPCFKIALHDPEAFLDLPSAAINADDIRNVIFQVCAYGIETIVLCFIGDGIIIKVVFCDVCCFSIGRSVDFPYEALIVCLPFMLYAGRVMVQRFPGPFDLALRTLLR